MEWIGVINSQLVPIELDRDKAIDRKADFMQRENLIEAIKLHEIELEAVKVAPYYQVELSEHEKVLNKKVQMWTNEQYEDFKNKFIDKYFDIRKG